MNSFNNCIKVYFAYFIMLAIIYSENVLLTYLKIFNIIENFDRITFTQNKT